MQKFFWSHGKKGISHCAAVRKKGRAPPVKKHSVLSYFLDSGSPCFYDFLFLLQLDLFQRIHDYHY